MQTIESTEYLRRKLALLDERSVRRWPRWENDDYIAVRFLLDDVAARTEEPERQLAQAHKATSSPGLRITYICARCGCFAEVPFLAVEVFDSGTTLICSECGEATVFSLSTPENYAEAEGLRQELREAKADLATMDADRQDDRLSNPHFGTSPRYLVEIQRDRLKDECEQLRQELQVAREIVV